METLNIFFGQININPSVLKKQLSDFCYKLSEKIENAYAKFIERNAWNKLVEDTRIAIKQRIINTLNKLE